MLDKFLTRANNYADRSFASSSRFCLAIVQTLYHKCYPASVGEALTNKKNHILQLNYSHFELKMRVVGPLVSEIITQGQKH